MTAALCVANLRMVLSRIDNEARSATKSCADGVMTLSKEKYCPVDTGAMKSSGIVEITKNTAREYQVTLSYGKNLNYPIYVHEIPYHHNHGSWKFLSIPFNQASQKLASEIGSKVKL